MPDQKLTKKIKKISGESGLLFCFVCFIFYFVFVFPGFFSNCLGSGENKDLSTTDEIKKQDKDNYNNNTDDEKEVGIVNGNNGAIALYVKIQRILTAKDRWKNFTDHDLKQILPQWIQTLKFVQASFCLLLFFVVYFTFIDLVFVLFF